MLHLYHHKHFRKFLICSAIAAHLTIASVNLFQASRTPSATQTQVTPSKTKAQVSHEASDASSKKSQKATPEIVEIVGWERKLRPFAVTRSSERFEWTNQDGLSDHFIRTYANNPLMEDSIKKSNQWTRRRQLVYVREKFNEEARAAYQGGSETLVLPGFDGEEFELKVDSAVSGSMYGTLPDHPGASFDGEEFELKVDSAVSGSMYGTLPDHPGASFVAGSENNHWSVVLNFPNRNYEIFTREPGEFVISEIDNQELSKHIGPCPVEPSVDDVGLSSTK